MPRKPPINAAVAVTPQNEASTVSDADELIVTTIDENKSLKMSLSIKLSQTVTKNEQKPIKRSQCEACYFDA